MVRKGKSKKGAANAATDGEHAQLDEAIARADAERAAKREQIEAKAANAREAQLMASQIGIQEQMEPQLRVHHVVEKLDTIPAFAIMRDRGNGKKTFVPMRFADYDAASKSPEVCAFFIDPAEAKRTLAQAQAAAPDMTLVIGTMPLGHAFSLTVGWADATGSAPFTIRGSAALTKDCRSHLCTQLEQSGLPSYWQIPVIVCEELQSPAVLPVFFTHGGLAATWKAKGHAGAPPTRLNILDLRLLVDTMLKPYDASQGVDWRVVRFLGDEQGSASLKHAFDELDAAGGLGTGRGRGDAAMDAAALAAEAAANAAAARTADPEVDPPPLDGERPVAVG